MPDEVLIASHRSSRHTYHLRDPADPDLPRCHSYHKDSSWREREREEIDDNRELCKLCDPDHEIDRRNTGDQLASKLEGLSSEDVGRRTAGGDA